MSDNELADSILRKAARSDYGHTIMLHEDGAGAVIDSGWFDVTDEEYAYLKRLRDEADA